MPLVGNLRDFALHDFLYLVARGRKTGSLVLRQPEASATLFFDKGKLFSVVRPQSHERMGEMFIRTGKITPAQLQMALRMQSAEHTRPIGIILVEQGHITEAELHAFVQMAIQSTVYELFTWRDGEFEFRAGEPPPPDEIQTPVPLLVENLIMEGVRRVDEMSRIKERIPDNDMIVRLTERVNDPGGEVNLSADEWRVFARVDAHLTINDFAQQLGWDSFQVSSVVFGLLVYGLVEVTPVGAEGQRG